MELRVIGYFLTVADRGSVTAAAEQVRVAQPSVSRQLRALERELGVDLFHRGRGALRLTAAGERFVPIARDLVGRAERAREMMRSAAERRAVRLRLACPAATLDHVVAPFAADGGAAIADVLPRAPEEVFAAVERSEVDVGISTAPPPPALASLHVADAPLRAQVPAGHRLAGRAVLSLEELAGEPLILVGRASRVRRILDEALVGAAALEPVAEPDTSVMAQAMAAAGEGVCIVSDHPAFGLSSSLIAGPRGPLRFDLFAGWDADHYAGAEIRAVLELLAEWMRRREQPEG